MPRRLRPPIESLRWKNLKLFSKCREQEFPKFASAFNGYVVLDLIIDENGWKSPTLFSFSPTLKSWSSLSYKQNDCNKESMQFMSILSFFNIILVRFREDFTRFFLKLLKSREEFSFPSFSVYVDNKSYI